MTEVEASLMIITEIIAIKVMESMRIIDTIIGMIIDTIIGMIIDIMIEVTIKVMIDLTDIIET
jgi:hypothetical protein